MTKANRKRETRRAALRPARAAAAAAMLALACGSSACAAPMAGRDLHLSYAMPQAKGETIPYRVYLPRGWTAARKWPLVVILHGYSGTADSIFDQAGPKLRAEADRHGFVLLAPNGYNGMADYGANLPLPSALSRMGKPLEVSPEQESALAEADVLNVLERTSSAYAIDPARIYLMGNSMGMTGVLHLAAKMPRTWCAISPSDGPPWPDYPVERLKDIPGVLFVQGGRDDIARPADTQHLTERARAAGANARMHLVPEGTHASAWIDYLAETMQFFADADCARRRTAPDRGE